MQATGMEDVLKDRRSSSDWWWILRRYKTSHYALEPGPQVTRDIKGVVLGSQAVQNAIEQLAAETGRSRDDVESEAAAVVDQMGHLFTMKAIRFFGLLLAKTFKRLYTSLDVNLDGLEAVRRTVSRCPILLMPTHRSYVDFLVISYVFFHYNLPLPVIAAGQDFTSMKVMGRLMRHAGAFFIRRSFGGDRLYWTIFAEYIGTVVVNGDAPLEFFVEGTRSRSGKSLFPKYGLLASALEPFFKAQVPDIAIVPIAICYDRTLEESLYAHEMLGVPKPKETTLGLLKAMQILGGNYGSIKMVVGEPISVKEFCGNRIDRSVHSCCPRYLSPITRTERELMSELAHNVLDRHRELLPIRPFVVIAATARACISMQSGDISVTELSLQSLATDVRFLIDVLEHLGFEVDFPGDRHPIDVIRDACTIHENIVEITEAGSFRILELPNSQNRLAKYDIAMNTAVAHLHLDHYGNQVLHAFVPEGILALVIFFNSMNSRDFVLTKEWVCSQYCFLEKVLELEFVISKGGSAMGFDRAVCTLEKFGALAEINNHLQVFPKVKIVAFLSALFEPFILAYRILAEELLNPTSIADGEGRGRSSSAKDLAKRAQKLVAHTLNSVSHLRHHHGALSLELLANGVYALHNMGAIRKEPSTSEGVSLYGPVYDKLQPLARRLDLYSMFPFGDQYPPIGNHNPHFSTEMIAKL